MPAETRVAILECAGNCRVFLVPQVQGAQWELGAVGNAEWTGVPLSVLLERAGLEEDACAIVQRLCSGWLNSSDLSAFCLSLPNDYANYWRFPVRSRIYSKFFPSTAPRRKERR
jgi:DMSO/TMAO reductase YedYZ molybdopterin-dependent catalytic subunit